MILFTGNRDPNTCVTENGASLQIFTQNLAEMTLFDHKASEKMTLLRAS